MKIKSYKLFLEERNACIDEDTIPLIRKIILDRLDGEVIDGMELSEYVKNEDSSPILKHKIKKLLSELKMNHFHLMMGNHFLSGTSVLLFIRFKSDKIIPYIEAIREDIKGLDLKSGLRKGDDFTWVLQIWGGF